MNKIKPVRILGIITLAYSIFNYAIIVIAFAFIINTAWSFIIGGIDVNKISELGWQNRYLLNMEGILLGVEAVYIVFAIINFIITKKYFKIPANSEIDKEKVIKGSQKVKTLFVFEIIYYIFGVLVAAVSLVVTIGFFGPQSEFNYVLYAAVFVMSIAPNVLFWVIRIVQFVFSQSVRKRIEAEC